MKTLLQQYGWQYYCQKTGYTQDETTIGRIKCVNKTNYEVLSNSGVIIGELSGQLLYSSAKWELPQTGDWVSIMIYDDQCIITEVLPRYSELGRKQAGRSAEKQLFAANIDLAFIVQGLDRDFNPRRLERIASALNDAEIKTIILLNKADLLKDATEHVQQIEAYLPAIPVLSLSALTSEGIEEVKSLMHPQQTHIMIGTSGAGKSTLLNTLLEKEIQVTNSVSEAVGKGKHTTTNRELFVLPNGSLMIDTAGIREFGLALNDIEAVGRTFTDIHHLAQQCKFKDCTHTDEPSCAVISALEDGLISAETYESYLKLKKEAEHYAASQQDKKRKGKDLSKLVRDMKKKNTKKRY
ncbi:ribosome small subunit-dependent GTPase A [Carboxylicivirga taeanensis]|uniref:ribosome small subunit-dependent GTPase A n=1 Tax=Carboxylicivirga taeanensis TaxID=1416875 RepID=UPI003F6DF46E